MSVKNLSNEQFLQAIRNNEHASWDRDELERELQDPRRIDAVRRLVTVEDKDLCLQLIQSKNRLDILLFHSLARSIIRQNPEEFVQPLSEAINYWSEQREEITPTIVNCLYHELFEHSPSLLKHRKEFCEFICNNPRASRKQLSVFLPTEQDYIEVLGKRLSDVFNTQGSGTLNNPEKAFTYILYLGLVQEPTAQAQAREIINSYMARGDDFFQQVCERAINIFDSQVNFEV